jgi:hydroxymethylpyrimidine pyrophosphatase-like HAD family hydrolase
MSDTPLRFQALASDYDGTLATNGRIDADTLAALYRLKQSGRQLILVTGREMRELTVEFPQWAMCDAIVAENGGLVVWPAEGREELLAEAVPEALVREAADRGVHPYSVGKVVFATWRPHESTLLQIIQELGLEHKIVFNKQAVMVLPSGINKATGLAHVLRQLKISSHNVVGVGDAENDHAFLDSCAVAVAVDNALPAVKERCDLVMSKDHGAGVVQLIERMLADDLRSLGARRPRDPRAEPHPLSS